MFVVWKSRLQQQYSLSGRRYQNWNHVLCPQQRIRSDLCPFGCIHTKRSVDTLPTRRSLQYRLHVWHATVSEFWFVCGTTGWLYFGTISMDENGVSCQGGERPSIVQSIHTKRTCTGSGEYTLCPSVLLDDYISAPSLPYLPLSPSTLLFYQHHLTICGSSLLHSHGHRNLTHHYHHYLTWLSIYFSYLFLTVCLSDGCYPATGRFALCQLHGHRNLTPGPWRSSRSHHLCRR